MGLQARQLQTQKLAPRMIQSMEILQCWPLALQERIEQEMNENPLLEQQEVDPLTPQDQVDPKRKTLGAKTRKNWLSTTTMTIKKTSNAFKIYLRTA